MQTETDRKNAETSAREVEAFKIHPPVKYFLYVNAPQMIVTTWTGEYLGWCRLGTTYRDNFGGTRRSIEVHAISGKRYHGTYFESAGDYARITQYKAA